MSQKERLSFKESMKFLGNYFMTGDGNAKFSLTSENEENVEIKNTLKKNRLYLIAIFLWVAIFVLIAMGEQIYLLVSGSDKYWISAVTCFIGFLGASPLVIKYFKSNKGLKEKYDGDVMLKAVQEVLPGAVCEPDKYLDAYKLYKRGVVPEFRDSYGSYLISYSKNGSMCGFSNLTLEKPVVRMDGSKTETVFKGQAYILNYKFDLQGTVRIIASSKNSSGKECLNGFKAQDKDVEKKVETENIIFNDNFEVYATDEHSAFFVLTPYVMEQLLMMKRYYGRFGVAVSANDIIIALNTDYYLFGMPKDYHEIEQISVENSKKSLMQMLQLAQGIENSINGKVNN